MNKIRRSRLAILAAAAAALLPALTPPAVAAGPAPSAKASAADPVDQMIVKLRPGAVASLDATAAAFGVSLARLRELAVGAELYRLDRALPIADARRLAARLAALPAVEYAEPDQILQPLFVPNDTLYGSQWHYREAAGGINVEPAWDIARGAGVVVAVLDTGYRPHADLVGNLLPGYDFISAANRARDGNGRDADASDEGDWGKLFGIIPVDSSWHGTHVAGTIAASTHNGIGVAGVAFDAQVMPVRVLGKNGGTTSDIVDAIVWASGGHVAGIPDSATPARVINMSLGGSGACSSALQNAIDGATGRGTLTVVAAGNDNGNAANQNPANCNGVVTVAATGRNGGKASYSNFGAVVELAAPGGAGNDYVVSTYNTGNKRPGQDAYAGSPFQGTSMAAPHVAGVAALIWSKNPSLTPAQVTAILVNSARPFPAACSQCGSGIVDAAAALLATP